VENFEWFAELQQESSWKGEGKKRKSSFRCFEQSSPSENISRVSIDLVDESKDEMSAFDA